jgi:hypothetical protein
MDDAFAKEYLHNDLREVRSAARVNLFETGCSLIQ